VLEEECQRHQGEAGIFFGEPRETTFFGFEVHRLEILSIPAGNTGHRRREAIHGRLRLGRRTRIPRSTDHHGQTTGVGL
jgi:hypothetical protein